MARTVFPTDEIAHLWAHKTQQSARNGGRNNFYFDGDVIYSYGYHFSIAAHVEYKGKPAIIFTTRGYSSTTAKHKQDVWRAIPGNIPVFHLRDVPRYQTGAEYNPREGAQYHASKVQAARESLAAATRKPSVVKQYRELTGVLEEANRYQGFFETGPEYEYPANRRDLEALTMERTATLEAARDVRRATEWVNKSARSERARLQALKFAEEMPELLEQWRNGGNPSDLYGKLYSLPVMLRLEGANVATSHGARVPVNHARLLLAQVRRVIASGTPWQTNGHTIHIGPYAVDRIDTDGTVHAGCHHISWDEISRFAHQLESAYEVDAVKQFDAAAMESESEV